MMRTIEQILGIQPMNQKDTAATPMASAFTQSPDFTPFKALPNRTSLTAGVKTAPSCGLDTPAAQSLKAAAVPSPSVPADMKDVATQWDQWKTKQRLTGPHAVPDYAPPLPSSWPRNGAPGLWSWHDWSPLSTAWPGGWCHQLRRHRQTAD